ncbi:MAG: hypothetical protein ABUL42_02035 [Terricaulis silvestris]
MSRSWLLLGVALAAAANATGAHADPFSGDQLRGFIDFRTGVADSEQSWLRDGYGKTRFSGDGGDYDGQPQADAMLIWRPHFTWSLDGYLSLQDDTQLRPQVDVVESFLSYRGEPSQGWRFSGRLGLFYPPVSLEHDGPGWTTTNTITPSALNSWIGEEVKVVGAEASARHTMGDQQVTATLALFGYNDTSGTLLYGRGWAMGDVLSGVSTKLPIPYHPSGYQDYTRATAELDGRVGYYARVEYKPMGPVTLDALHYDNAGDRRSDTTALTDWETQFTNVGLRAALGPDTRLLAQTLWGQTVWGQVTPMGYWGDVDFNASYVLLAHDFDRSTIAGRLDYFQIHDRSFVATDNNNEHGWAATADYQLHLAPKVTLAFEGLYLDSNRPVRATTGVSPQQEQTTVQSKLQIGF